MLRPLLLAAAALLPLAPLHAQTAAPEPQAEFPLGRLSEDVQPFAYRLDLTIDPSAPRFSGTAEIDTMLRKPARIVHLHGRDLAMTRAVARVGRREIAGRWRQLDATGVGELAFDAPLPAGPVTFAFAWDAPFGSGPVGLFRTRVGEDWHAWTQFQSIDARAAFPSFDQPSFKTPFATTLRTPPGLMAVSNGPLVATTREGGLDVHRFAPTPPLPTYLVAFMVGPFVAQEGTIPPGSQRARPLPQRVVTTRQNAGRTAFALDATKDIVLLLEDYFGSAYPYAKLDQITSPIMPGAMENAGAVLYQDSLLVLDRGAPVQQQRRAGMVIAHELAHQWFGNLVTPVWWDDIWLNESFANWMGFRIGDAWKPSLNIRAGALAEGFAAMETDALVAGRPIRQEIATSDQVDAAFDSITYGKGGHVVGMIAGFMGDAKFRDGVRRHMAKHRWGNATGADFYAALAEAAGDPRIVAAMRSFTEQQGVPLLTFSREGDRWRVTQSRYAMPGATPPAAQWTVPMCVTAGTERRCALVEPGQPLEFPAGAGVLSPNAGGTGYYRFELPRTDWDALIAVADRLPGGEAQALADSLGASFRAGRADAAQLVALAGKLARHPDSYASAVATEAVGELVAAGLSDEKARDGWRRFVARTYRPLLARHGFDPRLGAYAGEDPEIAQHRAQAVYRMAGTGRDARLASKLADAAGAYLDGDRRALDPAWFGAAFEAHLRRGGSAAAKALVQRALASEDPLFRPAALDAAAESGRDDVARWLLDELADPRLRPSEKRDLLRGVIATGTTREYGFRWFTTHVEELIAAGGIFQSSRLPRMLSGFCWEERAREIEALRPRFAGTPGALELERTIERVRTCGALKQARSAEFTATLRRIR